MSSAHHEKSFVDFERPYEQNVVGLKGIVYFGVGLLLLIIITFALMWVFLSVLEKDAAATKKSTNPMAMSDKEKLPPEPRLQLAPGFEVEGDGGKMNLELRAPQAEYLEVKKLWDKEWKEGQKDARTGAMISMPIDKAKELVLQRPIKAKTDAEAGKSILIISDASSGRMASLRRR
ncbi:MAG TPA: hypothetical protein VL572_13285 [Pyrinomonadaceae bacterium]|nr:hypothetical protein [Pyrinomonadaceae bacterium]